MEKGAISFVVPHVVCTGAGRHIIPHRGRLCSSRRSARGTWRTDKQGRCLDLVLLHQPPSSSLLYRLDAANYLAFTPWMRRSTWS
jgi:hypothetical protein